MTLHPLVIILFDNLLPGQQIVYRLEDLGYRVQCLAAPDQLQEHAEREKPLLILVELLKNADSTLNAIKSLKSSKLTAHIPILAFTNESNTNLAEKSIDFGVDITANNSAILDQLTLLLDQLLHVE